MVSRLAARATFFLGNFSLDNHARTNTVLTNMSSLTSRQREVLDFISKAQLQSGVMPSTREIQEHFRFASQTAAVNHLRALERKGVIQRRAGKARGVAVVANLRRESIVDIPVYGSIAAGMASTVEQENEGLISVDSATVGLSPHQKVFGLKVRGDSMIGAQIDDGDFAILELREPRNNDIVAALIDGESTLKRYIMDHGRPFLRAENPRFPDLIPVGELVVQGVMVALIRKYRH
jgi:repressor LexA